MSGAPVRLRYNGTMQNTKATKRDILTISQLNRQAKRLLEGQFPSVWVEGEISNLARPSSGHWYFSLKDSSAQIRCAMFRSSNARLRFTVEAGLQVVARAKLSLYEARGDYQLIVEHLEPAGDGALAKAFEALKSKLSAQGLFDSDKKQALPAFIRHIAVVTSATGAAIRDIVTVTARRFPSTEITVLPTQVQGKEAAVQIANAIDRANALAQNGEPGCDFDVILVGRGGGSLEDLWPFNEEIVAVSIHNSQLPVVSAVGHEVDFTIADFVADVRAATPSAAAELLTLDQRELIDSFSGFEQLLIKQIRLRIAENQQRLHLLRSHLKHPGSRLQEHNLRLDDLEQRLLRGWHFRLRQYQHRLDLLHARLRQQTPSHAIEQLQLKTQSLFQRLQQYLLTGLKERKTRLQAVAQLLNTVSPLATLDRGYAIVTDADGHIVTAADQLNVGQTLNTRLADGSFECTVNKLHDA